MNTAIIEVEMILNSRPISYVSTEDQEEPLTPSHLMVGRRLLNLPDNLCYNYIDQDYSPHITQEMITRRMRHLSSILDDGPQSIYWAFERATVIVTREDIALWR